MNADDLTWPSLSEESNVSGIEVLDRDGTVLFRWDRGDDEALRVPEDVRVEVLRGGVIRLRLHRP